MCCNHLCQLKLMHGIGNNNTNSNEKEKDKCKTTQSNLKSSIVMYKYKCYLSCNDNLNKNLIKGFIGMYTEL